MRVGILIIGSLFWDERRELWRRSRLLVGDAKHVRAPMRYGRRAQGRGNTFTMTFGSDGPWGQAVQVPCKANVEDVGGLIEEAEALWQAERLSAQRSRRIGADWGCVGVLFREDPPAGWLEDWTRNFRANAPSFVRPVDADGMLRILWPERVDGGQPDVDIVLATATRPEATWPTPDVIADAWVDQSGGHEHYFFENVRHGIRTAEDGLIWRTIEHRAQHWLQSARYGQAVGILSGEKAGGA